MFLKKEEKIKILSLVLAVLLWLNPLVAPIAWAEEGQNQTPAEETITETTLEEAAQEETKAFETSLKPTNESTENPQETQNEPTPTPESLKEGNQNDAQLPSPMPTSEPSSDITTGDAEASSEVETTANINETTVSGEITVPEGDCGSLQGETGCPGGVAVSNDNSANVADDATSLATTGDNQIQASADDAFVDTGDAVAAGIINNEVNTNAVVLEPTATPSATPTPREEELEGEASTQAAVAPTPTESPTLLVENENEGKIVNNVNIEASTGENSANQNAGEAAILTGDALAWVNILNFLNTNIVGSNFKVLLLDILEKEEGDIDLNQLWKEILGKEERLSLASESNSSGLQILIQNLNEAYLENNVDVGANSGKNQANENEKATVKTGEAAALANVNNFVNINILGAKFFWGTINILGDFEGNLILPQPENFAQGDGGSSGGSVIFDNQNKAEVENQLVASASTGENEENNNGGENLIETGEAQAIANSFSLANLNIWKNNWFFLLINNLGNWRGRIFGWSTPEAAEESQSGSEIFEIGLDESQTGENLNLEEESLPLVGFQNQNQATVKNNIQTTALSGGNQSDENDGETTIKTGNAFALTNLFNFVNLNILGGRWFFGLVNVLGNWQGNAIFSYPDVMVALSNGSGEVAVGGTTEFTLVYQNQGYEEAKNVVLEVELPEGVRYLKDTSGYQPQVSGRNYSWNIGKLGAGEKGEFKIKIEILPDFPFEEHLTFWSKIIPQVQAAEGEILRQKEITVNAFIFTPDPESNSSNNSALAKTLVYLPVSSPETLTEEETLDQRQPVLEVSAWNNVGEFVYPGDTVTFEIRIRNKGEVPAYDVYLIQTLHNSIPGDFGTAEFNIGKIGPGRGVKLSFGLKLAEGEILPAGHFYTLAQAFGKAPNGNEVYSNQARTDFNIKYKEIAALFEVKALGKEEEILGVSENNCPPNEEKVLPYVLLFLLSSLWIVEKSRKVTVLLKGNEN